MKKYIGISIATIIASCSTIKKAQTYTPPNTLQTSKNTVPMPATFDRQGHRGCRGLMPENTIPAMLHALELGVTTLEMDICISKDQKVFLSHEPFLSHEITTKPDGTFIQQKDEQNYNMYQMNYADIITYDVGLKPHPRFAQQKKIKAVKPLLADVFEAIKTDMITRRRPFPNYNIETKTLPATDNKYHPAPAQFVELLIKVIYDNHMEDFVTIQSFDVRTLQYLHQKYPTIKTALLVEANNKNSFKKQLNDLGFYPTIYSPEYTLVHPNLVQDCHTKGIQIIPWTVNDASTIAALKAMGVHGIITDYPNLLQN